VGWKVTATSRAEILPLRALDMSAWDAGGDVTGLVHHADHGLNCKAMVYTDRIGELGAVPSTGTVGDSFDNDLAEAVSCLCKTELIRQQGSGRTVVQVELAILVSDEQAPAGQGSRRNESQADSVQLFEAPSPPTPKFVTHLLHPCRSPRLRDVTR
jgi:hypothetical protein